MSPRSRLVWPGLPLLTLLLAVSAQLWSMAPFPALQNAVFDGYNRWQPRQRPPLTPVRVVDIDEESLNKLGQWPWPRGRVAALIGRLQQQGVAAIAMDIVFAEPDRRSPRQVLTPWFGQPEIHALAARLPDGDRRLVQ